MNGSGSPRPPSPRVFSPRTQTVDDIVSPTPSLAYFLASDVERVPTQGLHAEEERCAMCHKRFRDSLHIVAPAKPSHLHKRHRPRRKSTAKPTSVKLPPTPPRQSFATESPFQSGLPLIPGLPVSPQTFLTSGPSCSLGPPTAPEALKGRKEPHLPKTSLRDRQLAPPLTESPSHTVNLNDDTCGIAIKVTMPGCGHVFGARCLVIWIMDRWCRCSVCKTTWFKREDKVRTAMVLRENWP
jgi:hypothetical protein